MLKYLEVVNVHIVYEKDKVLAKLKKGHHFIVLLYKGKRQGTTVAVVRE